MEFEFLFLFTSLVYNKERLDLEKMKEDIIQTYSYVFYLVYNLLFKFLVITTKNLRFSPVIRNDLTSFIIIIF